MSRILTAQAYPRRVSVSAHDVAAALRQRLPGVPTKKLHKLLYYCQAHHLAAFHTPLFHETISAWDMGPVVGTLWYDEKRGDALAPADLGEAELNTIGYVVSRYGALSGRDLENLTHGEEPWRRADRTRRRGESARIEPEWIEEYFVSEAGSQDDDEVALDSAAVAEWLSGAPNRREQPAEADDLGVLRARLSRG